MSAATMTLEEMAVFTAAQPHLQALREHGFAVIIWTPPELEGVSQKQVEDRSIELGYDVIEDLK